MATPPNDPNKKNVTFISPDKGVSRAVSMYRRIRGRDVQSAFEPRTDQERDYLDPTYSQRNSSYKKALPIMLAFGALIGGTWACDRMQSQLSSCDFPTNMVATVANAEIAGNDLTDPIVVNDVQYSVEQSVLAATETCNEVTQSQQVGIAENYVEQKVRAANTPQSAQPTQTIAPTTTAPARGLGRG